MRLKKGILIRVVLGLILSGLAPGFYLTAEEINQPKISKSTEIRIIKEIKITNTGDCNYPVSSPDGKYIAFVRYNKKNHTWSIWKIKIDGTGQKRLTLGPVDNNPTWSPDGKKILFTRQNQKDGIGYLRIMNPDGSDQHLLNKKGCKKFLDSSSWSPDGKQVAFDAGAEDNSKIYILDIGRAKLRKLITPKLSSSRPCWSPDGKQIVYECLKKTYPPCCCGYRFSLWKTNLSTGKFQQLTQIDKDNPSLSAFNPSWSPDGKWIAFLRDSHIWLMRPNGVNQIQLTMNDKQKGHTSVSWFSDSRRIIFSKKGNIWIGTLIFEW